MSGGQVTIKDIARQLGVSPSTVSRALKDHPDISVSTKKAINDLAEKLNYSPDPIALSLKSRKSNIIGVVVPEIVHYFFSTVIHGIEDIANLSGYNVMICESDESFDREVKNIDALLSSRVDGILISLTKETRIFNHFIKVQNAGIPLVFFDRVPDAIDTDKVIVDDEAGSFEAVEHLIKIGCKRIVHLSATEHLKIAKNRKNGYLRALRTHKIQVDPNLIVKCDVIGEAKKIVPELLSKSPRPDGFFAVNDLTAAETLKVVKKYGYRVPEDIAIIGFTNGQIAMLTDPALSSVEQHGREIGENAARLLIDRLTKKEAYPSITKVIKTQLVKRESSLR